MENGAISGLISFGCWCGASGRRRARDGVAGAGKVTGTAPGRGSTGTGSAKRLLFSATRPTQGETHRPDRPSTCPSGNPALHVTPWMWPPAQIGSDGAATRCALPACAQYKSGFPTRAPRYFAAECLRQCELIAAADRTDASSRAEAGILERVPAPTRGMTRPTRRGDIVVVDGKGDSGKPRPAVVIQADLFDALQTVAVCCR